RKNSSGEAPSADGTFSLFADTFKTNKKDKRTIKHNALLNKVHAAGISKEKKHKRRRPAKKLNTDVGDLADALPDVEEDEWEGISDDGDGMEIEEGKMVLTSLKHKPGAMKKKTAMEEKERERFRKNLAQMMGGKAKEEGTGQADKWKALRAFIGSTMEKHDAFAGA
ncbi:hypothetical protein DOTSEDRAFT_109513, partial [Dothistroma septosporum NZE10]